MDRDFTTFKRHFTRYQQMFGLTGYSVYFKYEPLDGAFGEIRFGVNGQSVAVVLNSNLPEKEKPHKDIRRTAKHEAIHLLLTRLESNARWRHTSKEEIDESAEELVIKLEGLIKD